jgi:hypothetical protein
MISGSGDMILRPESGSSQDVLIGNPNQVGDVEMGAAGIPINLKILGGGTITGNGNTLNIGSATDVVNIYNAVYSQSFDLTGSLNVTGSVTANTFVGSGEGITGIISSSYALTASHALNGGGGGGGGTPGGSDTQVQFNDGGSFGGDAGFTFNKTTNSITAITNITASGNISSSANVIAKTGSFSHLEGNSPITVGDQINFQQPLTASIISASSYVGSITSATTASYAVSASHLIGGGGSVPAGTVSGSSQITELGFVTSSATASFVTNAETGSFLTNASTASFNNLIISYPSGNLVPGNASTSSIAVTVADVGGNKYHLDGVTTGSTNLTAGNSYKFDQSDASNDGHPFRFSTDTGGSSNYATGVTTAGTPGNAGAYTQISVTNTTPTLYYYCTNHSNMGLGGVLSIITGSVIQNGFLDITGSLNILSGSVTVVSGSMIVVSGSYNGDGSGLTGIVSSSYAVTASHALNVSVPTLQQVTDQGATTTNDITASANISLPTNASSIRFNSAELHGRTGGSYPGLAISSGDSTNARIWIRDTNAGTGPPTMSFVGQGKITGVQTIESQGNWPLIIRGGAGPNDANDGVQIFTGDASNVYQQRFAIEADGTSVDAYFHNINGLGINDTTPSAMLDVNGNINTTSHITASGNISSSGNVIASNVFLPGAGKISFDDSSDGTDQFISGVDNQIAIDGDNFVKVYADKFVTFYNTSNEDHFTIQHESGSIVTDYNVTASGIISSSGFVGDGSGLTNLPAATTFPFTGSAIITGSLVVSASSHIDLAIQTGSSATSFETTKVFGERVVSNNNADFTFFQDEYIKMSIDESASDVDVEVLQNPSSGRVHFFSMCSDGTDAAVDGLTSNTPAILETALSNDTQTLVSVNAPDDTAWPIYKFDIIRTNGTYYTKRYIIHIKKMQNPYS